MEERKGKPGVGGGPLGNTVKPDKAFFINPDRIGSSSLTSMLDRGFLPGSMSWPDKEGIMLISLEVNAMFDGLTVEINCR